MLVLLMTAVTGAWAQEQSETIATTANIVEGTHFTISISEDSYADEDGMLADGGITVTSKNGETITKVVITCTCYTDLVNDGTTSVSSGTKEITNGGGTITVTGVNASTFTFTCSDDYPQFGQFVVYYTEATVAVTGVTLAPTEATLTLGETETVTLIPTVLPGDATDKSVTWSSSNEAVATVADGVVTAVGAGEATITVTTTDGAKTATCAVTVAAPAASTYTVTLKDGTEDATSWTIAPAEATTTGVAAGTEVKATYGGVKKVKSVKAVKKAAPSYTMAAAATTSDKGKLICTAGHIHVYGEDAACTAGRVAKIIYVGPTGHATYNHGLALALEDMSTLLTWDNSGANNDGKTAAEWCSAWNTSKPVTDAEWLLASKDQWNYMLGTNGAGSSTTLLDGFTSVGGSNLESQDYWSSTEYESNTDEAWMFNFGYDWWYDTPKNRVYPLVRACLAF